MAGRRRRSPAACCRRCRGPGDPVTAQRRFSLVPGRHAATPAVGSSCTSISSTSNPPLISGSRAASVDRRDLQDGRFDRRRRNYRAVAGPCRQSPPCGIFPLAPPMPRLLRSGILIGFIVAGVAASEGQVARSAIDFAAILLLPYALLAATLPSGAQQPLAPPSGSTAPSLQSGSPSSRSSSRRRSALSLSRFCRPSGFARRSGRSPDRRRLPRRVRASDPRADTSVHRPVHAAGTSTTCRRLCARTSRPCVTPMLRAADPSRFQRAARLDGCRSRATP